MYCTLYHRKKPQQFCCIISEPSWRGSDSNFSCYLPKWLAMEWIHNWVNGHLAHMRPWHIQFFENVCINGSWLINIMCWETLSSVGERWLLVNNCDRRAVCHSMNEGIVRNDSASDYRTNNSSQFLICREGLRQDKAIVLTNADCDLLKSRDSAYM